MVQIEGAVKKSEKQARVKLQDAGGQDQFVGDVLGAAIEGAAPLGGRGTPVTIDEFEVGFDSLATAETTGKITLYELVKTNFTLTSSIAKLSTTNTRLNKEVESLSQELNKYKKGGQEVNDQRGKPA